MKVKVVLSLSSKANFEVLLDAIHYTNCMTSSSFFNSADFQAQLAATGGAINLLRAEMEQPFSEGKQARVRKLRDVLDRELSILAGRVEAAANQPRIAEDQRIEIVRSAGMNIKGVKPAKQRVFTVENTDVIGMVSLTAQGGPPAHEWQYTDDTVGFTKRINAPGTTTANTQISGLSQGTKYAFFHKPIVAGKITEWEGPLFLIVS